MVSATPHTSALTPARLSRRRASSRIPPARKVPAVTWSSTACVLGEMTLGIFLVKSFTELCRRGMDIDPSWYAGRASGAVLVQQVFFQLHKNAFRNDSFFNDVICRRIRAILYDAIGQNRANAVHRKQLLPCSCIQCLCRARRRIRLRRGLLPSCSVPGDDARCTGLRSPICFGRFLPARQRVGGAPAVAAERFPRRCGPALLKHNCCCRDQSQPCQYLLHDSSCCSSMELYLERCPTCTPFCPGQQQLTFQFVQQTPAAPGLISLSLLEATV